MRLINTQTLQLHEFYELQIPLYVILSHRWTDEEISLKDFSKGRRKDTFGYRKVLDFCAVALKHGYHWGWIDTVCIDKRSSAEISEAINSMFQWYAASSICFAYLRDFNPSQFETMEELLQALTTSEWFDRGWCLQELLAPNDVTFFAGNWTVLGRKSGRRFLETPGWPVKEATLFPDEVVTFVISQRTGIPISALEQPRSVPRFSVAQRMSWASHRKTTRTEDMAYCLLGLFQINMPLLYGEGKRAFKRLQLEIIRASHDESIYAWTRRSVAFTKSDSYPLIADSPEDFSRCGYIVRVPHVVRQPWNVTHHGLEVPLKPDNQVGDLELPGFKIPNTFSYRAGPGWTDHLKVAIKFPLGCKGEDDDHPCQLVIARARCGHWCRIFTDSVSNPRLPSCSPTTVRFARQQIYIHLDECEDLHTGPA